jgi:RIO-like serine/threonine protein kinase
MLEDPEIPALQELNYHYWHCQYLPIVKEQLVTDFIDDLVLAQVNAQSYQPLKIGNSAIVLSTVTSIGELVIKYYKKAGVRRLLSNMLSGSRALRTWRFSHYLMHHGVKVPEPIALFEEQRFGTAARAMFVARKVDAVDCREFFNGCQAMTPAIAGVIDSLVELFIKLKHLSISHGDTKATNILLLEGSPCLIDFDSMHFHTNRASLERHHHKDIQRFMRNWRGHYVVEQQFIKAFGKHDIKIM